MTHFRALSRDRTRRTAPIDSSIGDKDRKEIGSLAVWQLSSAKSSCGVEQLRDGNLDTYWQYDELHLDQSYHAKRLLIDKPMCARALSLSLCVCRSDGTGIHLVNIQFARKETIDEISINVNFKVDESYTPQRISIRVGSTYHDLQVSQATTTSREYWQPHTLTHSHSLTG
jgi:anaphase-promoting complex subunit 10